MMLSGMKKLRVVSLLSGMDHPFISISLFLTGYWSRYFFCPFMFVYL